MEWRQTKQSQSAKREAQSRGHAPRITDLYINISHQSEYILKRRSVGDHECRVMVSGATISVETARMSMTTLSNAAIAVTALGCSMACVTTRLLVPVRVCVHPPLYYLL